MKQFINTGLIMQAFLVNFTPDLIEDIF